MPFTVLTDQPEAALLILYFAQYNVNKAFLFFFSEVKIRSLGPLPYLALDWTPFFTSHTFNKVLETCLADVGPY